MDNEIKGVGNNYTAEYWQYSSRLGRRWNIDPVMHYSESSYATFRNNPILFIDPNGDDVINGDQIVAKEQEKKVKQRKNELSDFMKKNNITSSIKRKDFLKNFGSERKKGRKIWKQYKKLEKIVKHEVEILGELNNRANLTQSIIDKWKNNSPDVFNEVDNKDVDFVLFSKDLEYKDYRGYTSPQFEGSPDNPTLISREIHKTNAVTILIHEDTLISDVDEDTGQYSLNHEAGHFLYIVKYTSKYIKYRLELKAKKLSAKGGHRKDDESGKVANKYGSTKNKTYEIKESGN